MSLSSVALCYITHEGEPHFNMAFDEWLFERAVRDDGMVALRLYTWRPGAITIGLNQHADMALDWPAVGKTIVIRRATGGRALYHDPSELTYSVTLGADVVKQLSAPESAQRISALLAEGLTSFLTRQGVGAEFVRQSSPVDRRPVAVQRAACFASTARYELVSNGRKVVASAQRRIGEAVLQHGSIKMGGVVHHPALIGTGDAQEPECSRQSIGNEQLKAVACDFFEAMGKTIGVAWKLTDEPADDRLASRVSQIVSAPLDRREFH